MSWMISVIIWLKRASVTTKTRVVLTCNLCFNLSMFHFLVFSIFHFFIFSFFQSFIVGSPVDSYPHQSTQAASQLATRQLGAGRSSKFPSTSKQIQHHWHTIRSHNHSCNKMAKQWCLDSDRIFNLRTWPALRAGQAQTLKYLTLCKHHCLAILLQLWLWLLIECQQF